MAVAWLCRRVRQCHADDVLRDGHGVDADLFLQDGLRLFAGLSPADIGACFGGVVSDPLLQIKAMLVVVLSAAAVCTMGLQNGLERVTKVMMLCLLVLIIVLAVNSIRLEGAMKGLAFYLVPDFARMREVGMAKVIVEAMNHAFFTLSLGIGAMAIFGSYFDRNRTLFGEAINVCLLDTFVAICAGW